MHASRFLCALEIAATEKICKNQISIRIRLAACGRRVRVSASQTLPQALKYAHHQAEAGHCLHSSLNSSAETKNHHRCRLTSLSLSSTLGIFPKTLIFSCYVQIVDLI
uniref:Secreted protein n=1 Tax=Syphacia muris TaxID=451379 RepID=A0A0N5B0H7_9BILA